MDDLIDAAMQAFQLGWGWNRMTGVQAKLAPHLGSVVWGYYKSAGGGFNPPIWASGKIPVATFHRVEIAENRRFQTR